MKWPKLQFHVVIIFNGDKNGLIPVETSPSTSICWRRGERRETVDGDTRSPDAAHFFGRGRRCRHRTDGLHTSNLQS